MSEPLTDEQKNADVWWQDNAPDGFGPLLQADTEQVDTSDSDYLWIAAILLFARRSDGKQIPPDVIRAIFDDALANGRAAIDALGRQLITGEITAARWSIEMGRIIEQVNFAGGAAARGGWGQLTGSDTAFIRDRIGSQLDFLSGFYDDVISGKQKMTGQFLRRARMYGDSGRGAYEDMRRLAFAQFGYTEERRILGAADHCPDCLEYAGLGWQPAGTLPPIGDSICRTNCRCTFQYRNESGDVSQ